MDSKVKLEFLLFLVRHGFLRTGNTLTKFYDKNLFSFGVHFSLNTVGWHRVVKDNGMDIVGQNSNPLS